MSEGSKSPPDSVKSESELSTKQNDFIRPRLSLYLHQLGFTDRGLIDEFVDQVIASVESKTSSHSRNEFLRRAFEEVFRRLDAVAKDFFSPMHTDKKVLSSFRSAILLGPHSRLESLFEQRSSGNRQLQDQPSLDGVPVATPQENPASMPEQHIRFFFS